jgi:hypothetical protein
MLNYADIFFKPLLWMENLDSFKWMASILSQIPGNGVDSPPRTLRCRLAAVDPALGVFFLKWHDPHGGFLEWGYPNNMDDLGVPLF